MGIIYDKKRILDLIPRRIAALRGKGSQHSKAFGDSQADIDTQHRGNIEIFQLKKWQRRTLNYPPLVTAEEQSQQQQSPGSPTQMVQSQSHYYAHEVAEVPVHVSPLPQTQQMTMPPPQMVSPAPQMQQVHVSPVSLPTRMPPPQMPMSTPPMPQQSMHRMTTRGRKGQGKTLPLQVPAGSVYVSSHFPNLSFGGLTTTTDKSALDKISLDEEYLGLDSNYPTGVYDTRGMIHATQSQQHEQVDTTQQHGQNKNYTVQVDDSSPLQYASSLETDELLTFSLDSLTGVDCDSTLRDYVLPEIDQLTKWEKREKIMIKEINDRYINHSQLLALFAAVQNQLGMIETLLSQAKAGTVTFKNDYQDDILDAILNRLENINAEAQAYFNKWTKDADLVEIANAECNKAISKYETLKSQVKLLQVHLEKAGKSINAAIALKQTVARLNKENNGLKRIIKQHGMDPTILLKAKEAENPSLLSPGDASKEDEAIVRNLNLAAEDLISYGVLQTQRQSASSEAPRCDLFWGFRNL